MTTIVWDGCTMAADKQSTDGNGLKSTVTKIRRINGCLVGISGTLADGLQFFDWFERGCKADSYPEKFKSGDTRAMVVDGRGTIKMYESTLHPIVMEQTMHAIGSGRDFALAAVRCGKSAREAVLVAHEFDAGTGSKVDELRLPQRDLMGAND